MKTKIETTCKLIDELEDELPIVVLQRIIVPASIVSLIVLTIYLWL